MAQLTPTERREATARIEVLAREAGTIAMRYFGSSERHVRFKQHTELVTEADIRVEEFLRDRLNAEFSFGFIGEETGVSHRESDRSDVSWVVDPIDGTTNFARDIPHFATSIGLWEDGRATIGVIYNPAHDECFVCDGEAVRFNDRRLPRLEVGSLSTALLATGFPYDRDLETVNNTAAMDAVVRRCLGVRRFGAAALDLAWVAAGRYEGFWEPSLKPWDVTAGIAMIETLGGRVTNYAGESYDCTASSIVAGRPQTHEELLNVIRQVEAC